MRGLQALGAHRLDYLIPDRAREGYGLTPEIVERAAHKAPRWLLTVDNGINSVAGVEAANRLGMRVIITDHHLPGATLPAAHAIVNPNQAHDAFASKAIAGVGVVLYLLMALRRLRPDAHVALAPLLDLVALGTIADCVPLDANNRLLVRAGLQRINAGKACPGIQALLRVSGRRPGPVIAQDLGFQVGPRLNAAGRLADMSIGVRCLLATEEREALALAQELDRLNRERRRREDTMHSEAEEHLTAWAGTALPAGLCVSEPHWHPGIVGILAGRLRERYKRPVIALAPADEAILRGSARSVPELNMRDALVAIGERHPDLLLTFGGHAAAAGLTIRQADLGRLAQAFAEEVERRIGPGPFAAPPSDGPLRPEELSLALARAIRAGGPWGNGFPEPVFEGVFTVVSCAVVKGAHLKLALSYPGLPQTLKAWAFRCVDAPETGLAVAIRYRLGVDAYQGSETVCLYVEEWSRVPQETGLGYTGLAPDAV